SHLPSLRRSISRGKPTFPRDGGLSNRGKVIFPCYDDSYQEGNRVSLLATVRRTQGKSLSPATTTRIRRETRFPSLRRTIERRESHFPSLRRLVYGGKSAFPHYDGPSNAGKVTFPRYDDSYTEGKRLSLGTTTADSGEGDFPSVR